MDPNLLHGSLVRLMTEEPEVLAEAHSRWDRDSEYQRLLITGAANQYSLKKLNEWIQKNQEKDPPTYYVFAIRSLEGDHLIGSCNLSGITSHHSEAFVGIGIGEREFWGKGYGTDAMQVMLRYAFLELNLRRVSLDVAGYNPRAIHSYEKAGFIHEGKVRGADSREGQRWDAIYMGILRQDWLVENSKTS